MIVRKQLGFLVALALVGALPVVSEASFARRVGSRYGGTLSSNSSIRTQQLTADPVTVLRGSTSTEYDPSVVRLNNVFALDGFFVNSVYVAVTFDGGETEQLITLGQFIEGLGIAFQETGYLQVFYQREEGQGFEIPFEESPNDGYVVVDTGGEIHGDLTHSMLFNYIAEDLGTIARYRLYADNGSRGFSADSLVSIDDPNFEIRDIEEATVAGAGNGALIPLPAAFGPGLVGLAVVGLVKKYRKRVVA